MSKLKATIAERGELADALRGIGNIRRAGMEIQNGRLPVRLRNSCVGIGYVDGRSRVLPQFIVIRNADRREFFAWVNTYCPFATPLTQWCRVVDEDELARVHSLEVVPRYGDVASAWAGAIVGESILRLGTGNKLFELPVTSLQTRASFVAARAFGLWGSDKDRIAAMGRHESAQSVLGIASHGPNLKRHQAIWTVLETLASGTGTRFPEFDFQLRLTIEACDDVRKTGFVGKKTMLKAVKELGWSEKLAEFERCDAEQRVALFDKAAESLGRFESNVRQSLRALGEFIVAYFAARIGGSASAHMPLLARLVDSHPMVALWYGVASALYRPEIWGAEFNGLGRLVLKELAFPLRFEDPPRCDIAVDELAVLADPGADFKSLKFRGAMHKALNVEVALGVNVILPLSLPPERTSTAASGGLTVSGLTEILRHLTAASQGVTRLRDAYGHSTPERPSSGGRPQSKKKRPQSRGRGEKIGADDKRRLPLKASKDGT